MTPLRVDLHIHSTASDGKWPPAAVFDRVRQSGIGLFAVADHDTIASVRPIEDMVRGSGLSFLRAVEISTTLNGQLFHILAYGIDLQDRDLIDMLASNRAKMEGVDSQSVQMLIDAGYEISHKDYDLYENDITRGGWKALNLFIDRDICTDVNDFFTRLFVGNMALDLPSFVHPTRAAQIIHRVGGLAICAHPGHSIPPERLQIIDRLIECGIDGLECLSPYHDPSVTAGFVQYCRERQLLITAGSDCHGGFVNRAIGRPAAYLSDLCLGSLLERTIE